MMSGSGAERNAEGLGQPGADGKADELRDALPEPCSHPSNPALSQEGASEAVRSRRPFRCVIYPRHGPLEGVDVSEVLVDAIARILWRLHGGNAPVNRLEATALLDRAMRSYADEATL